MSGTAGVVGSAAVQAGQAVAGAAVGISGAVGGAALQATQVAGQALAIVGNNPPLQRAIKSLNKDCDLYTKMRSQRILKSRGYLVNCRSISRFRNWFSLHFGSF